MKRLIPALVLTAALLLAAPSASAASLELSVNGPESVRSGEAFTVTVELSGEAAFYTAQFTLAYDREEMECTEVKTGPLLADMLSAENPAASKGAIIAAASADPVETTGGVLGTFYFKAKTDLDSVRLSLTDIILSDAEGKDLDFSVSADQEPGGSAEKPEEKPETPEEKPEEPGEKPEGPGTAPEQEPPTNSPAPVPAFPDTAGHWAEESIGRAAGRGLIGGYADGTFRPDQAVTRKQMAVILWRMAGKPQPEAQAPFTDLEGCGQEFRDAIAWGYGNGLINGTSASTFSPDAALTRQAAMKLLFGYAGGQAGAEALLYTTYDGTYTDSAQISSGTREAVYWAVYNGILNGNGQALNPRGTVSRAQLSAILIRYLERGDS